MNKKLQYIEMSREQIIKMMESRINRFWSLNEEKTLRNMYPKNTWSEIMKTLPNRTKEAIRTKAYRLGVKRSKEVISKAISKSKKGTWSKEEVDNLKRLFQLMSIKELQEHFPKRSLTSLHHKTERLGLIKQKRWSKKEIELLIKTYPFYLSKQLIDIFPDRTRSAILGKAYQLRLVNEKKWSRHKEG